MPKGSKNFFFIHMSIAFILLYHISTSSLYSQTKSITPTLKNESITKDELNTNDGNLSQDYLQSTQKVEDESITEVEGENLFSTVKQGGPIMIFVVLLGIISITLVIERIIFFTKNKVWDSNQIQSYLKEIADKSSARYREDMEDELRSAFQVYTNGLERGMSLLSGIGNLSPIVGFLGTVIGMISAFAAIAAATTVNAKVVAVGIQIALVTTAGGLMVAAPSLAFYYLFAHLIQNRYVLSEEIINQFCENLPRISEKLKIEEEKNGQQ